MSSPCSIFCGSTCQMCWVSEDVANCSKPKICDCVFLLNSCLDDEVPDLIEKIIVKHMDMVSDDF